MPRAKKSAPAAPAPKPFEGFKLALSGKFSAIGYTQSALEALVKELGGTVGSRVDANTTHLVCTEDDFKAQSTKVVAAQDKDIPILKHDWLLNCSEDKKVHDVDDYLLSTKSANGAAPASSSKADDTKADDTKADTKTKASVPLRGTKRKADDATASSQKASQKKKAADDKKTAKAEEEETKEVADGQFIKRKDVVIPLDEYCPSTDSVVYIDPDTGMIYDASLNQSNSSHNNNKFYRIQLLRSPKTGAFETWTRWGRVGEVGQSAMLGDGSLATALKQFEKKFKDKSGLSWEKRGDDPKPGKYAFIERSYNPDSDDDDNEEDDDAKAKGGKGGDDEDEAPVECTLEKPVQDLMSLIFNQQYFQATMASLNYDSNKLPLGKLSKTTITRGFQQLKDLAALINDPSLASSKWNMPLAAAKEHLSNTYYSVIPHAFGRNRPPIINENSLLKKEIELLESLSDMKDAAEIMKVDRKSKDTVHALDRQFQGLGLSEMTTLDPKSTEFDLLSTYLHGSRGATHNVNYKIDHIWRIERDGEKARFDQSDFSKVKSDRRLLWHGSRCTNFGGILSQGLRIAPPEAPVTGYMFGKGIYLADMSSKSAGYCASGISNGHALLLLCEAELGSPMQELTGASYSAGETAKQNNQLSTWGKGRTGPNKWVDAGAAHPSLKGIQMPDTNVTPGPTNVSGASLFYNEYICYDVAQIRLRYLFRVKM